MTRFPHGEWEQVRATLRLGTASIELGQRTPNEREARTAFENAQKEFAWLLSRIAELLKEKE